MIGTSDNKLFNVLCSIKPCTSIIIQVPKRSLCWIQWTCCSFILWMYVHWFRLFTPTWLGLLVFAGSNISWTHMYLKYHHHTMANCITWYSLVEDKGSCSEELCWNWCNVWPRYLVTCPMFCRNCHVCKRQRL